MSDKQSLDLQSLVLAALLLPPSHHLALRKHPKFQVPSLKHSFYTMRSRCHSVSCSSLTDAVFPQCQNCEYVLWEAHMVSRTCPSSSTLKSSRSDVIRLQKSQLRLYNLLRVKKKGHPELPSLTMKVSDVINFSKLGYGFPIVDPPHLDWHGRQTVGHQLSETQARNWLEPTQTRTSTFANRGDCQQLAPSVTTAMCPPHCPGKGIPNICAQTE